MSAISEGEGVDGREIARRRVRDVSVVEQVYQAWLDGSHRGKVVPDGALETEEQRRQGLERVICTMPNARQWR